MKIKIHNERELDTSIKFTHLMHKLGLLNRKNINHDLMRNSIDHKLWDRYSSYLSYREYKAGIYILRTIYAIGALSAISTIIGWLK